MFTTTAGKAIKPGMEWNGMERNGTNLGRANFKINFSFKVITLTLCIKFLSV